MPANELLQELMTGSASGALDPEEALDGHDFRRLIVTVHVVVPCASGDTAWLYIQSATAPDEQFFIDAGPAFDLSVVGRHTQVLVDLNRYVRWRTEIASALFPHFTIHILARET